MTDQPRNQVDIFPKHGPIYGNKVVMLLLPGTNFMYYANKSAGVTPYQFCLT
jgi:hypothetical protein